jgi:outer membrane protein OmpA-like peptidoglycan-associated protein
MSTPGLAVTVEARGLTSFGDQKFHNGSLNNPTNVSGLVGLRYAFGAPVAASSGTAVSSTVPAPMTQAAEARTYLVFFDWDKTELTSRARQIIADAAGATSRLAVTRIEVAGHADSSGTAPYNQGLSLRRGQVVAAELVRNGVKQEAISVTAFGDTRPLVQTAPGGREPQNRRVEIVLK